MTDRRWRDDLWDADEGGVWLESYLVAARLVLPLALRAAPLRKVLHTLSAATPRSSAARARLAIVRSEALAARIGAPSTCLYRAMARWAALCSAGLEASFVMGVRRDAPEQAHAWVEIDGAPVDEARDDRLVVTFRFPQGTTRALD